MDLYVLALFVILALRKQTAKINIQAIISTLGIHFVFLANPSISFRLLHTELPQNQGLA